MTFARRALQRRIDELRLSLDGPLVDGLASRLNRPGSDQLAAMWEVAVLHGLSKQGALRNEDPLPSGRRPDLGFTAPGLSFTADVITASDEGLDEQNPYEDLSALIEEAKTRLGLKIGGVDLRVLSREERTARGSRTVLGLPERKRVQDFVRHDIEPRLREQIAAGETVLRIALEDETAGIQITIDPCNSPLSSGGYAAYDVPTIKDRNPLYKNPEYKVGIEVPCFEEADATALAKVAKQVEFLAGKQLLFTVIECPEIVNEGALYDVEQLQRHDLVRERFRLVLPPARNRPTYPTSRAACRSCTTPPASRSAA